MSAGFGVRRRSSVRDRCSPRRGSSPPCRNARLQDVSRRPRYSRCSQILARLLRQARRVAHPRQTYRRRSRRVRARFAFQKSLAAAPRIAAVTGPVADAAVPTLQHELRLLSLRRAASGPRGFILRPVRRHGTRVTLSRKLPPGTATLRGTNLDWLCLVRHDAPPFEWCARIPATQPRENDAVTRRRRPSAGASSRSRQDWAVVVSATHMPCRRSQCWGRSAAYTSCSCWRSS